MKSKKKKILFIENRTATFYYDEVSKYLNSNYEIHWIIQNNFFLPKNGIKHIIQYPEKKDLKEIRIVKKFKKLKSIDRGRRYFHQKTNHYYYYFQQIKKILKQIRPDLIVGETDLFHELITVELAKKFNIRYLFPSGTRYPKNRTTFLKYDNFEPISGSNNYKNYNTKQFKELVKKILNSKYKLDYMRDEPWSSKLKRRYYQFIVAISYLLGEKYNTPSPFKFLKLNLEKRLIKILWKIFSNKERYKFNEVSKNNRFILYPLQIQPEVSSDAWGYPYNEQEKIIIQLSKSLKKIDYNLAIKINPKLKYELKLKNLLRIKKISNIVLIPNDFEINYLLKKCAGVFSITGTVIIEAILHNKPIFTLSNNFMSSFKGVTKIKNYRDLISKIKNNSLKNKSNNRNGINLFKKIYKFSFDLSFNLSNISQKYSNEHKSMANLIRRIEKNENF